MIRGAIAIFKRDFKKFLSNPFVIGMTLMMPIMYLVIFGNAMGGTISHIPVGVVQEGPRSRIHPFLPTLPVLSIILPRRTPQNCWM